MAQHRNHDLPTTIEHHPHGAMLLHKISEVEQELEDLNKHTLVWDDRAKQLKKIKLRLRDELRLWQRAHAPA